MAPAEHYRQLAAQLRARAHQGGDNRAELENLAQCYTRLAEQAEQNETRDQVSEPVLRTPDSEPRPDEG